MRRFAILRPRVTGAGEEARQGQSTCSCAPAAPRSPPARSPATPYARSDCQAQSKGPRATCVRCGARRSQFKGFSRPTSVVRHHDLCPVLSITLLRRAPRSSGLAPAHATHPRPARPRPAAAARLHPEQRRRRDGTSNGQCGRRAGSAERGRLPEWLLVVCRQVLAPPPLTSYRTLIPQGAKRRASARP